MKKFYLLTALLLAVTLGTAQAQDCERGELDARFCDTDGDLLADTPESGLLDPSTLVFTYAPTEDPAVYQDAFAEFLDYLSERTGREVVYFPVNSYAAQIEAMRAGRLHVSGFAAGAVQEAGARLRTKSSLLTCIKTKSWRPTISMMAPAAAIGLKAL